MFKRYSYQGGVCDPMVIHWPKGIEAKGEVRHQYHHAIDVVPTILEACGLELPEIVNGYEQTPIAGVSMKYSFDAAPDAPSAKQTQYYAMLGTRGIWHEGWKAVAEHGPTSGIGHFDQDRWQLFHTDVDRAEAHDLAERAPGEAAGADRRLVRRSRQVRRAAARRPHAARDPPRRAALDRPRARTCSCSTPTPPSCPERSAPNIRGRSFKILAEVEITDADAHGVLLAHGSRFGGHSLFIKDRKLFYVNSFIGVPPEQQFVGDGVTVGKRVLGMEFVKESIGDRHEAHGTTKLYIDDQLVAEGPMRTQPGHYALCGEGLTIGRDSGAPVSVEYAPPNPFTGGRIRRVEISLGDDQYLDLESDAAAMMARE